MQGHVRAWEFIVDIGPHLVTGRRHQKNQSGFATKRQAKSALHEFIRHVEAGGDPSPSGSGWATSKTARTMVGPAAVQSHAGEAPT